MPQDSADAAKAQWLRVADQLRAKLPKLAAFMDEAEDDVLAYRSSPAEHWSKLHSTDEIDTDAMLSDHHLAEGSVDVDADHPSHLAPPFLSHGSGGRHDTHGFALAAQPGESRKRPAANSSSRLMK